MPSTNGKVVENSESELDSLYALVEHQQVHLKSRLDSASPDASDSIIADYLKSLDHEPSLSHLPRVQFDHEWQWFNVEEGLSSDVLLGRVSVIDFFTYCCINCMHILPDLEALEDAFPDLLVVGMHSAKFDNEKVSGNIGNAVKRYGIRHPVANDWRASLWNKFVITCWPTLLVTGPDGRPLATFIGEGQMHYVRPFVKACQAFYAGRLTPAVKQLPAVTFGVTSRDAAECDARESLLSFPGKVHLDRDDGTAYVSDTANHRIVMINTESNQVIGHIGSGRRGFMDAEAFAGAQFNSPQGLTVVKLDGRRVLYVCDTGNHALRACDLDLGTVTTAVGNGKQGQDLLGGKSGPEQELASPWDVCLGHAPSPGGREAVLFIAMAGSHQIWAYALAETVKFWKMEAGRGRGACFAVAGSGKEENRNTSYPMKAAFAQPSGVAFEPDTGTLYISDAESSSIRKLCQDGAVKNVAGGALDPCDLFGFGDADGAGTAARLQHPLGVCAAGSARLVVADSYNHKLKFVTELDKKKAKVTTILLDGGVLNEPGGLSFDPRTNSVLVANTNAHSLCRVSLDAPHTVTVVPLATADVTGSLASHSALPSIVIRASQTLKVELSLPTGKEINIDAPNECVLSCPGLDDVRGKLTSGAQASHFTLNTASWKAAESAKLTLKVFLCEKDTGTCTVLSKAFTVQLKTDESSPFRISSKIIINIPKTIYTHKVYPYQSDFEIPLFMCQPCTL